MEGPVKPDNGHIQPYRHIAGALGALFILTFITVMVSRLELGRLGIWISLAVAASKSAVVLIMFMHIRQEGKAVYISFLTVVFILALVIGILFLDITFRD